MYDRRHFKSALRHVVHVNDNHCQDPDLEALVLRQRTKTAKLILLMEANIRAARCRLAEVAEMGDASYTELLRECEETLDADEQRVVGLRREFEGLCV
jgi:hypothetical protein